MRWTSCGTRGLLDYVGLGARDIPYHRAAIESGRVDVILTFADYNLVRRQASGLIDQAAAAGVGVLLGSPQMLGLLAKGDPRVTARKAGYGYFPADDVRGRGRVVGLVPGARGGVSSPEHAVRAGPAGDQRGADGGGDARRRLRRTCGRRGRGFRRDLDRGAGAGGGAGRRLRLISRNSWLWRTGLSG